MKVNSLALKAVIENHYQVNGLRSSPAELVFVCPVPGCGDETGNRSVNLKSGLTNCWRCQQGFHVSRLLADLGVELQGIIDRVDGIEAEEQEKARKPILGVCPEVNLPDGFTLCSEEPDSVWTRQIAAMAVRKNLTIDDLNMFSVGFTKQDAWWNYAIFPVTNYGRVVYYQGRGYWDDEERGKKFPSRDVVPHGSANHVYNIDTVNQAGVEHVIIVESILNVISLTNELIRLQVPGVVPVSTFSAAISPVQRIILGRTSGLKEVTVLFDRDATSKGWKCAQALRSFGNRSVTYTVAEMPDVAGPKSDPNDDASAAWQAVVERKQIDRWGTLDLHSPVEKKFKKKQP